MGFAEQVVKAQKLQAANETQKAVLGMQARKLISILHITREHANTFSQTTGEEAVSQIATVLKQELRSELLDPLGDAKQERLNAILDKAVAEYAEELLK